MACSRKKNLLTLLTCLALMSMQDAFAWDSVGHRVSAAIASNYLNDNSKTELLKILQQHPRYRQDFLGQMPASIASSSEKVRFVWLLGQAAFWPDITRRLPGPVRKRYNRANWHYIDGAWLRGQAQTQGNTYIGVAPFEDITDTNAQDIRNEENVDNVMTALDYNAALLADSQASLPQRAVALCWVLHLVGDIHQPLHTGSLYSSDRFSTGDRGGNGIKTDGRNLHARWDRALSSEGVNLNIEAILRQHSTTLERMSRQDDEDWSLWMQESRALLLNTIYTEEMKSAIARSDDSLDELRKFDLSDDYVESMKYHARLRLAVAGRRLAFWFETNL